MTKAQIEKLLSDDNLLRATCMAVVETAKRVLMNKLDVDTLAILNRYSPDEYIEFARKNLKEKLSKM